MKLKKLTIRNFRGIGFAEIDLEDFTTLVGPNNIGKSTILNAINLVLDNKKPKDDDWPRNNPEAEEMEITCELRELEEWEKRRPAVSQLLFEDKLIIKMLATGNSELGTQNHDYFVYNIEEKFPWSDENFTVYKTKEPCKSLLNKLGITKKTEFTEREEELEEFVRENHPELVEKSEDWHIKKFANSLQQAVPHVMYVPASFKIEDELKTTSNSPFSFLFTNKLFPSVKGDESYRGYIQQVEVLQRKLKGQAEDGSQIAGLAPALEQISNSLNQVLDFDSKVKLTISDFNLEPHFLKSATLMIDDEIETSLGYQGSGVQRALAFAILESNASVAAEVTGETRTVIVLYEEPELYIHPHLMRRLKAALQSRANSPKWQVICSTHSPFLINIADNPESLKLLSRNANNERIVKQISSSIFENENGYDERAMLRAALDFHPTVCESLFAKRVVLVEGDTELAVFSMVAELVEKWGLDGLLHKDTTIVSAGGKWTIPAIIKILNGLSIDYRVIHDLDQKGKSKEELSELPPIHPFMANKKIDSVAKDNSVFIVEDTFEHVLWDRNLGDSIKSSDKPYNSWKRVRDYIDGSLQLSEDCENMLKEIVTFAYS